MENHSSSSLSEDVEALRRRLMAEAIPYAHVLHDYRWAGVTSAPEFVEPLSRLERLLGALFNTEPIARPSRSARPVRPRARRPERMMMSASRALKDGPVDTWGASVQALAAER